MVVLHYRHQNIWVHSWSPASNICPYIGDNAYEYHISYNGVCKLHHHRYWGVGQHLYFSSNNVFYELLLYTRKNSKVIKFDLSKTNLPVMSPSPLAGNWTYIHTYTNIYNDTVYTLSNFEIRCDVTCGRLRILGKQQYNSHVLMRFHYIIYAFNGILPEIYNLLHVTSHLISKLDREYYFRLISASIYNAKITNFQVLWFQLNDSIPDILIHYRYSCCMCKC